MTHRTFSSQGSLSILSKKSSPSGFASIPTCDSLKSSLDTDFRKYPYTKHWFMEEDAGNVLSLLCFRHPASQPINHSGVGAGLGCVL